MGVLALNALTINLVFSTLIFWLIARIYLLPHLPRSVGDFLAAILALIALPAGLRRARLAKPLVWIFNLEGSLDLLAAITLATIYHAAPSWARPTGFRRCGGPPCWSLTI